MTRETVSRLERSERPPLPDSVFRLEAALDLEPGRLVPAWPEWAPVTSSTLGASARRRRRELGLSLARVAALSGISPATLSRFERDEPTPTLVRIDRTGDGGEYATLLSVELVRVLGFEDVREFGRWIDRSGS